MALVTVLLLVLLMTTLGLAFIFRVQSLWQATSSRADAVQAEYLAESAANHAMWRLLNEPAFSPSTNTYSMHSFAGGRYGYKVRKHTATTFATVATVGAFGEQVARQSRVLYVKPATAQHMAVWSAGATPEYNLWDGSAFGTTKSGVSEGDRWRIMAGASSRTRNEKIVVGIEAGGEISGEMWDGSAWSKDNLTGLAYVSQTYWWSADVAYESQSGDLMLVWNGGVGMLRYKVWNGTSWTAAAMVGAYNGEEPKQMQLAANPNSDEMVLVVSDTDSADYALVWDGSSWGDAVQLHSGPGDRTDVFVRYESQSGDAMVVFAMNKKDCSYKVWNGSGWSSNLNIPAPSGIGGDLRWTTLASDPNSDRIILGALTFDEEHWFAIWDGNDWDDKIAGSGLSPASTYPNVAVAFESNSGDALVAYGYNSSQILSLTWSSSAGWNKVVGADVGGIPNSMMLDAAPASDAIMLSVQDGGQDLNYVLWNGSAWESPIELETSTGETKNQPFVFLWGAGGGGAGGGPPAADEMFVNGIDMTLTNPKKIEHYARAIVEIRDTENNPVVGAVVSGLWSGAVSGGIAVTPTTGIDGRMTFQSGTVKVNSGDTFTFTVNGVAKSGYTYNPALNVETLDSITVP